MKPEKDYADVYVEAYKRVYIDKNYKRSSKVKWTQPQQHIQSA